MPTATYLRYEWMRLLGCDEYEIASSVESDPPIDVDAERRELECVLELITFSSSTARRN